MGPVRRALDIRRSACTSGQIRLSSVYYLATNVLGPNLAMSGVGGPTVSMLTEIYRNNVTEHEQSEGPLNRGPPYPPRNHGLGGDPGVIPDVPITAVFLLLYLVFGVIHIKILKANKGRGHKFLFNGAILGTSATVQSCVMMADTVKVYAKYASLQCPCG